MIKKIFLFLWQLPQNLLGLLIILSCRAKKKEGYWVVIKKLSFGVSLGTFIIFSNSIYISDKRINHEKGHQKQSLYLGWLYLFVIGIPSILGNIYDRLFHKYWSFKSKSYWYYNLPWEKWADNLGGVNRNN